MTRKFKPEIFNTTMVKEILADRKTQTRRIVKYSKNILSPRLGWSVFTKDGWFEVRGVHENGQQGISFFKQPVCKGDIIWVRETWRNDPLGGYDYKANYSEGILTHPKNKGIWKPSIHMPKKAARLFLEVTKVSLERLNEISEDDAINEGIKNHIDKEGKHQFYIYPVKEEGKTRTLMGMASLCDSYISKGIFDLEYPAKFSFQTLWQSIYGWASWNSNPWVWVYEFKKIDKPKDF